MRYSGRWCVLSQVWCVRLGGVFSPGFMLTRPSLTLSQIKNSPKILPAGRLQSEQAAPDVKMYCVEVFRLKKNEIIIHLQRAHKLLCPFCLTFVSLFIFCVLFSCILEPAASSFSQTAFYHTEHRRKCVFS